MTRQSHLKQERIVEAVRQGLEGDDTLDFLHQSGYAMTAAGVSRTLKKLGGRGAIEALIEEGKQNVEILEACLPEADLSDVRKLLPESDLFGGNVHAFGDDTPLYETTKLSLQIPSELYEAIRAAAQAERVTQAQLITSLLTQGLSQVPSPAQGEFDTE